MGGGEGSRRVRLEVIEGDDVESLVIGFRQAGELHELAEAAPPAVVTLERPAVWMTEESDRVPRDGCP